VRYYIALWVILVGIAAAFIATGIHELLHKVTACVQ